MILYTMLQHDIGRKSPTLGLMAVFGINDTTVVFRLFNSWLVSKNYLTALITLVPTLSHCFLQNADE